MEDAVGGGADAGVIAPEDVDIWHLVGLPGALSIAAYLTSGTHATVYRLIVDVLLDHQQQSLQGVAHDDLNHLLRDRLAKHLAERGSTWGHRTVLELLDPDSFNLEARMKQLQTWGVVDAWEDRIRSDDDFQRHLARYQLTPLAARLHRAVRHLSDDDVTSTAATLAPPILADRLAAMRHAMGTDPAEVAKAWAVVQNTLTGMAAAAAGWQARLAGALSGTPDPDKLEVLQETLRRYVDMWGSGVDTHSASISRDARHLLEEPTGRWKVVALHTAGSDTDDARLDQLVAEYTATLATVLAWFDGPDSQARGLRRQMRDTISPLIRGQRTLAAVGGHVSRRTELLNLAEQLDGAPDESAGWRLWCTFTGLFSARHLPTPSPRPGQSPANVSFWDADPAPVEARLRRQGTRALTGRPARMADRSVGKAAARAKAAADRAAQAQTRARILFRSGRYLAEWSDLTTAETDLLIMFVGRIATTDSVNGTRRATTGDGLWDLVAEPAPWDEPTAVVSAPSGRLVFDNMRLYVAPSGSPLHVPAHVAVDEAARSATHRTGDDTGGAW